MMPIESLTDRELQSGELLSGLRCSQARLIFDMKYISDLFCIHLLFHDMPPDLPLGPGLSAHLV